ncbi:MAG: hypothetical protein KGL53_11675 [Elusimicrobia bacterium]|nr:hypothetical protein [Elusimicrobiota bacterium]
MTLFGPNAPWGERFWERLLLPPRAGPEAHKWVVFGRRLIVAVCGMVLLVSVGLMAMTAYQTRRLLFGELRERALTVAEGTSRAVFVPLSLEDRPAIEAAARELAPRRDLASLTVRDEAGRVWGSVVRPTGPGEAFIIADAPVRGPKGGVETPVGSVEVVMRTAQVYQRLARQLLADVLVSAAFIGALLAAGLLLVRGLTLRMQELVDEARLVSELRRSNQELEEFAYVASHDLQSPLRKVSGFAELLRERLEGRLDADCEEFVGYIVDGTRRMRRLIEDLLTYSRVGARQLEPVRSDLNDVARQVLGDLEPQVKASGATVEVGRLPTLTADGRQMGQLFQNLIGNALKFRGPRPLRVSVDSRRQGPRWLFTVQDNGIGIEPAHAGQLFKMFRRLHSSSAYEGSGIGLAIARKIVERHGGTIWVESKPGEGTAFRFTLESVTEPPPAAGGGRWRAIGRSRCSWSRTTRGTCGSPRRRSRSPSSSS